MPCIIRRPSSRGVIASNKGWTNFRGKCLRPRDTYPGQLSLTCLAILTAMKVVSRVPSITICYSHLYGFKMRSVSPALSTDTLASSIKVSRTMQMCTSLSLYPGRLLGGLLFPFHEVWTYPPNKARNGKGRVRGVSKYIPSPSLAVTWHPRGTHAAHPPLLHITYYQSHAISHSCLSFLTARPESIYYTRYMWLKGKQLLMARNSPLPPHQLISYVSSL
jgi:hypothetical protein